MIFGNQGNNSIFVSPGADTVFGGLGNDSIFQGGGGGSPNWFGNEGNDTMDAAASDAVTLVGGNDSADGGNSLVSGTGADLIFGNGGNDTILPGGTGANTVVGGQGGDCIASGTGADLIFGNEGNDTVDAGGGANTVFGGQGNDTIRGGIGRETIQGNEGNDTIDGDVVGGSIDTISGGSGNDVFVYFDVSADGDNAAGGGPVEWVTDVDWSVDRFDTLSQVTFATNLGAGTGADLNASANNAIAAASALAGGGAHVAAQFTFGGRTYLAIDQNNLGTFADTDDWLIDITGVTGTIATSNFI